MYFKIFLLCLKKTYIIFFVTLLFLNFTTSDLKSSIFTVDEIEIIEPFELNFKKKVVIDKAFKQAFKKLAKMTVASNQSKKLENIKISEIKNLIESFNIKNEKFVQNSYIANFEVNFSKQNTLLFFEKKNVFPSLPSNKDIMIFPIFIDNENEKINIFNQNPFLKEWLSNKKDYHLLNYVIPTEDLDLLKVLNQNYDNLEEYNYKNLIAKYGYQDFIVCLIYKYKKNIKVFSKIKIDNKIKITSKTFDTINFSDTEKIIEFINKIKNIYEDAWKLNNQINRSVKLAININVKSKNYNKNLIFESFLKNNELVSEFFIKSFNNETLNYKIIFNGSPNKFLKVVEENGIQIDTSKQVWFLN